MTIIIALACVVDSLQEELEGYGIQFKHFVTIMAEADDTWKFWEQFVFKDCLAYMSLSLFVAIRSGQWNIRMTALKSMAAIFSAFDHPTYQRLISTHMMDLLRMPPTVRHFFRTGGFVISITGRVLHSVGIAHETLINKHTKQTIVRPTKDYINRIAQYIPYRMKSIESLKSQLFPVKKAVHQKAKSFVFTQNTQVGKSECNIQMQMRRMSESCFL